MVTSNTHRLVNIWCVVENTNLETPEGLCPINSCSYKHKQTGECRYLIVSKLINPDIPTLALILGHDVPEEEEIKAIKTKLYQTIKESL